jgi:hypothetical protein
MRNTVFSCLSIALLSIPVYGQTGKTEIDIAAMAEDIEIMQRIINTTLQHHFGEDQTPSVQGGHVDMPPDAGTSETREEGRPHAMRTDCTTCHKSYYTTEGFFGHGGPIHDLNVVGYYVPGTGAVFTLDLPAATKEVQAAVSPESKPDLWEEIQGRLHAGKTGVPSRFREEKKPKKQVEIDQDALDRTINVLVGAVGEYGSRIEQLSTGESIILAARVNAGYSLSGGDTGLALAGVLFDQLRQARQPYRVIIEVPVSAVREFDKNTIDRETLRDLAEITKYRAHGPGNGDRTPITRPR